MIVPRLCLALGILLPTLLIERDVRAEPPVPAKRPAEVDKAAPVKGEATPKGDVAPARAERESLWEAGLGGGVGWTPDYPAAGQNHFRGLGLPFVIYRGEYFQAGERSLARGLFVNTDKVEFDLSFAGSLPADSSDNDAREGLDDLDFLGEVGPSLSYFIDRDEAGNQTRIDLSLRALLSTDFSDFDYVGLILNPVFAQEFVDVGGIEGLDSNWSIGARWADNGVMDLFYEVPVSDSNAAANREVFDADGGYLGTTLYGAFSYPVTSSFRLATGAYIASYHGSKNRDSDLFIDEFNVGVLMGLVWTLWKSETLSKDR